MALRRKPAPVAEPSTDLVHVAPKTLVASSARMDLSGQGWRQYRFGDDGWQQEAWRLYDVIGELRFVANWVGSALSRVRIYVAKVDRNGRVQEEVTEPKVAALADNLLGGPAAKSEAMRMLGINLTIAGDAFVVGTGATDTGADEWRVLSCSELRRYAGVPWFLDPDGRRDKPVDLTNSILYRIWTPHPRRSWWADSPTRAALPILYEIERLTRFVFAQIDSRLVSAGVLFVSKEASFPDNDTEMTGAEGLTEKIMRLAQLSRKGEDTAAGVTPIVVEQPNEALGKAQLLQFTSELSKQALELRTEALRRFGLSMDIDPAILQGAGDANHWGAWQITEGQIKIHVEPLMTRICDANTEAFLKPKLKVMKLDPARYTFAFDTAPLTIRPQRLKDTMDMYKEGHVSRETVLLEGDYKLSDLPTDKEDLQRFTRELMLRDPTLMQNPAIRKAAGYTEDILPAATVIAAKGGAGGAGGPPPPPPPPTGIMGHTPEAIPSVTEAQNAPAGPPAVPAGTPASLAAAAAVPSPLTIFIVANAAVLRALEIAGKRLLSPSTRGTLNDVPPFELHTRIPVQGVEQGRQILAGAWDHLSALVDNLGLSVDADGLREALHMYCLRLLVSGESHLVPALGETLRAEGLLDGHA